MPPRPPALRPRPRGDQRVTLPESQRILDGRVFEINRTAARTGVIYLVCATKFCRATARRERGARHLVAGTIRHANHCFEDRFALDKANFRETLKRSLSEQYWRLRELYDTIKELYPLEVRVQIPFNSILDSMKRWRRASFPPCPDTLELMARQLEDPGHERILQYDHCQLTTKTIYDRERNVHLLMYDAPFVRHGFQGVDRLFIDGTFQTTPQVAGVHQLVTLLAVRYDHAIPFAHILMSRRTESSYRAVLNEVRRSLINPASVRVVMTDFELALRNACREIFDNATIAGCSVHYDRALLKKMKTLRRTPLIRDNYEAIKPFLKQVMALAYLPRAMIQPEFDALVGAVRNSE